MLFSLNPFCRLHKCGSGDLQWKGRKAGDLSSLAAFQSKYVVRCSMIPKSAATPSPPNVMLETNRPGNWRLIPKPERERDHSESTRRLISPAMASIERSTSPSFSRAVSINSPVICALASMQAVSELIISSLNLLVPVVWLSSLFVFLMSQEYRIKNPNKDVHVCRGRQTRAKWTRFARLFLRPPSRQLFSFGGQLAIAVSNTRSREAVMRSFLWRDRASSNAVPPTCRREGR